jgi:hypothetical protein
LVEYYKPVLDKKYNSDVSKVPQCFYNETADMVRNGWDPPLAYMTLLLDKVKLGHLPRIRKQELEQFGHDHIKLYPGVESFLPDLKVAFQANEEIKRENLSLDYYIISGGIGDAIRSTTIAKEFKEIWACEFEYDQDGVIQRPKAVISFTEKTRYLFYINKGISREYGYEAPYAVNATMPESVRPVPLSHMIYVGDGASDIPCMSLLEHAVPPGTAILVWGPKTVHKAWEIGKRGYHCPRDYQNWGGRDFIIGGVLSVGRNVARELATKREEHLSKDVGYTTKRRTGSQ